MDRSDGAGSRKPNPPCQARSSAIPLRMPVIALDGKTLKGSFDHLNDRKAAQALSAFASEAAILLAHSEIDVKSNEIPAAQRMIKELGLTGVLFTADALHCQKNL
jgi:hypothetical protein